MPASSDGASRVDLSALYQELILDHFRRPRNRGALESPDATAEMRNPLCGDRIALQVAFDGGALRDVRFAGEGCAISQASASMMTQALKGKSRAEAGQLASRFGEMIAGNAEAAKDPSLGELRALAGVARIPVRVKCATLAWEALDKCLRGAPRGDAARREDAE
ncbi:MAG TPA: SUF system NifU family Fe-S cluster assembly protein [Gemmatimonadaceae bacterium]|nr:SUF system NifU family Fe-S cluster assembly protein [Gemmatimonadaceae bacterium]